jgi:5-formyltetrahydrofolate cyclo-ligase
MNTQQEEKKLLRQRMIQRRRELSQFEHQQQSERICETLLKLPRINQANVIGGYEAMQNEVNLSSFSNAFRQLGKTFLLPSWSKKNLKMFFGTLEQKIDVLIVPGMAFDRQGYRLGYGKGYYDRFLSRHPGLFTIGVCFDFQVLDTLPIESFDFPVNMIVTEKEQLNHFIRHKVQPNE